MRRSRIHRNRGKPCSSNKRRFSGIDSQSMPRVNDAMLNWVGKKVYLCCGRTDMRKSINGLTALVQESFKLDPFDRSIYVFCNRNRNRIKILEWDDNGFWLYFKRLEKGRFRWPGLPGRTGGMPTRVGTAGSDQGREASDQMQPGDNPVMALTPEELSILLNGAKVELKLKRNEVWERNIS